MDAAVDAVDAVDAGVRRTSAGLPGVTGRTSASSPLLLRASQCGTEQHFSRSTRSFESKNFMYGTYEMYVSAKVSRYVDTAPARSVLTKDRNEKYWKMRSKLWQARSRLYRRRSLQPNTHFAAFSEIYKICKPLHRSRFKISAKNRPQFLQIEILKYWNFWNYLIFKKPKLKKSNIFCNFLC